MGSARFLDPSSIPLKRQSGGNIWATLVYVTQVVTVIVLLSGLTLFFLPVFQTSKHYREEKANTLAAIANEQDRQQQLLAETELMKNDQGYVEHVARDKLNMGRPGETIIRFDSYQNTASDPKAMKTTSPNTDDSDR